MNIHLTRYLHNRTFTHGHLTIDNLPDTFETLEMAIPRNHASYIKHCLPPGTYPLDITLSVISIKEGSIRKPWLTLRKIKWFPRASLYTNFTDISVMGGRIYVGTESKDEWSIEQSDLVTARIISALEPIYDPRTNTSTEPVNLIITESPDIIYHDYDLQQYEAALLFQQEQEQKATAALRLQQLMSQSL